MLRASDLTERFADQFLILIPLIRGPIKDPCEPCNTTLPVLVRFLTSLKVGRQMERQVHPKEHLSQKAVQRHEHLSSTTWFHLLSTKKLRPGWSLTAVGALVEWLHSARDRGRALVESRRWRDLRGLVGREGGGKRGIGDERTFGSN